MESPKLALIPSGYKSGTVYSILPTDGVGDFDFSRTGQGATRVRKDGLIETVDDNVPRLDWLNSDCPSLLLEPQRTNVVYPNTSLSGYSIGGGFKSDNVTISPDGENNGSLVQSTGGTCVIYRSFGTSTNTTYNISVFLKKGNYNNIRLQEGFTSSRMVVNLSNGTEVSSNNATNKKIQDYGNGWYRVSFNYTSSSSVSSAQYSVYIEGSTASGNTFYTFGGQIEQGSYPTSYIKTTTTSGSVTRQKDICINGGDADLFNITEGTFFVDVTPFKASTFHRITLSNNTSNEEIIILFYSNNTQVGIISESGGSGQVSYTTNITFDTKNKLAFTFKNNEFKFYVNGSLRHTDTSGNIATGLNSLHFAGNNGGFNYFQGKVHDTRVYDRVLTESEAIELTTI